MSDLVANPEDRFSQNEAHFIVVNISVTDLNNMSPVVSTEDGKTAQVDIPVDLLLILGNL